MPLITPVSLASHGGRSWAGPPDFRFAADEMVLPLAISEVPFAVMYLPIGFIRQGEAMIMVLLLGFEQHQNLLIGKDGRWLAPYLPKQLRTYPFTLTPASNGEAALSIIESSGLVRDGLEQNPFFNADGELDEKVRSILEELSSFAQECAFASRTAAELEKAGLLTPWEITLEKEDGAHRVEGLFKIDEVALDALPNDQFLALRESGALVVAYCQLLSRQHLQGLAKRYRERPQPVQFNPSMELDFSQMRI